jgi:hypothetical protein
MKGIIGMPRKDQAGFECNASLVHKTAFADFFDRVRIECDILKRLIAPKTDCRNSDTPELQADHLNGILKRSRSITL